MITCRTAQQCGQADFGWLQARYTFSFGHYFDPAFLHYASLRALNQEVLAVGAAFQPRTYPPVDVLNLVLRGEAEYRDSNGHAVRVAAGDALMLAAQPGVSYSEHNIGAQPLTRMQLWLDACPTRENPAVQSLTLPAAPHVLLASPQGEQGSLRLRQQAWVHRVTLAAGESLTLPLNGRRAYVQSVYGQVEIGGVQGARGQLSCGDGAFVHDEQPLTLRATATLQALLIDLAGDDRPAP
ncbi:pirin family protein [Sodalis endosymbiont of Spalangia cameroni]|uniref:pirin family protein n=1 Tax=Sodalis praecaptivus TaxID=1239307 RepID=UPI0031F79F3C